MTDRTGADAAVPRTVLDAFGLTGDPEPLPGGEGRSIRVGRTVLKPAEAGDEASWTAELLSQVAEDGFRVARPVPALDGHWVVAGWSASQVVTGEPGPADRWDELLAAARAFHLALRSVPCPGFLDRHTHRWALADRVAWGEAAVEALPEVSPLMSRLEALRRPIGAQCQLVHGDLSGNVLFADGQPPAIIDFSPYWRPTSYADAVIAIDGVLWFDAGRDVFELAWSSQDFHQLLVRALIFRLVAFNEAARGAAVEVLDELASFERAASEVEAVSG